MTMGTQDAARLDRMERRLQALEDAEAIRNLKTRYAALCDDNYNADGIAALFTEDAVWESPNLARCQGREEIRAFFQRAGAIFSFAIHYSLNGAGRDRRRHRPGTMVSVYAVHGGRRQSCDVAGGHRPRTLCSGGRRLDDLPQAL